jgi:hypothetical protein
MMSAKWGSIAAACALLLAEPALGAAADGSGPPAPTHCPRACMEGLVDQYLAAMVRHDPSGLPLSKGVRFTENTTELKLGEGLWIGATEAPTTFRIYAVDPATSQVGFLGVMKERGQPVILALRLKVINGRITQIEHVVARNIRGEPALANLVTPRPAFLADVPADERTSREDMLNAADNYFEAIEHADGSRAPFADDCERHENGGQTTHNAKPVPWPVPLGSKALDDAMAYMGTLTCKQQFDTHIMDFITRLWPRRLEVVDEQKGLVLAFPMFNQEANPEGKIHLKNVPGIDSFPLGANSSNLQAGELFKIRGGKIHEIEAMGVGLPYGQKSGWGE